MYLHVGGNDVVIADDIIGIFDIENTSISKKTRDFLRFAQQNLEVINVSDELPKSFVLTKDKLYICPVSPNTLYRRLGEKFRSHLEGEKG